MVNEPTGVPLSDFQSIARRSDIKEDAPKRPHPDNPSILSPLDATEFLKANPHIAAAGVKTSGERRSWLTGGNKPDDYFILNWSGPLDSNYDWVTFGYKSDPFRFLAAGGFDAGWQWATSGSPHYSWWTPIDVDARRGYDPFAAYFIWSPQQGNYVSVYYGGRL